MGKTKRQRTPSGCPSVSKPSKQLRIEETLRSAKNDPPVLDVSAPDLLWTMGGKQSPDSHTPKASVLSTSQVTSALTDLSLHSESCSSGKILPDDPTKNASSDSTPMQTTQLCDQSLHPSEDDFHAAFHATPVTAGVAPGTAARLTSSSEQGQEQPSTAKLLGLLGDYAVLTGKAVMAIFSKLDHLTKQHASSKPSILHPDDHLSNRNNKVYPRPYVTPSPSVEASPQGPAKAPNTQRGSLSRILQPRQIYLEIATIPVNQGRWRNRAQIIHSLSCLLRMDECSIDLEGHERLPAPSCKLRLLLKFASSLIPSTLFRMSGFLLTLHISLKRVFTDEAPLSLLPHHRPRQQSASLTFSNSNENDKPAPVPLLGRTANLSKHTKPPVLEVDACTHSPCEAVNMAQMSVQTLSLEKALLLFNKTDEEPLETPPAEQQNMETQSYSSAPCKQQIHNSPGPSIKDGMVKANPIAEEPLTTDHVIHRSQSVDPLNEAPLLQLDSVSELSTSAVTKDPRTIPSSEQLMTPQHSDKVTPRSTTTMVNCPQCTDFLPVITSSKSITLTDPQCVSTGPLLLEPSHCALYEQAVVYSTQLPAKQSPTCVEPPSTDQSTQLV